MDIASWEVIMHAPSMAQQKHAMRAGLPMPLRSEPWLGLRNWFFKGGACIAEVPG